MRVIEILEGRGGVGHMHLINEANDQPRTVSNASHGTSSEFARVTPVCFWVQRVVLGGIWAGIWARSDVGVNMQNRFVRYHNRQRSDSEICVSATIRISRPGAKKTFWAQKTFPI